MIVSVISADGSTVLRKLEDPLKKKRKSTFRYSTSNRKRRKNWKSKPQPKFTQFDKEFKEFDRYENKLESRPEVETSRIEIPESFKHTTAVIHCPVPNEVNPVQVPQIFKSNESAETNSPKIQNRRKPLEKKWPPKSVKKAPTPEDPTRFYF